MSGSLLRRFLEANLSLQRLTLLSRLQNGGGRSAGGGGGLSRLSLQRLNLRLSAAAGGQQVCPVQ